MAYSLMVETIHSNLFTLTYSNHSGPMMRPQR